MIIKYLIFITTNNIFIIILTEPLPISTDQVLLCKSFIPFLFPKPNFYMFFHAQISAIKTSKICQKKVIHNKVKEKRKCYPISFQNPIIWNKKSFFKKNYLMSKFVLLVKTFTYPILPYPPIQSHSTNL